MPTDYAISGLAANSSPATGDLMEVVSGGTNYKSTLAQILAGMLSVAYPNTLTLSAATAINMTNGVPSIQAGGHPILTIGNNTILRTQLATYSIYFQNAAGTNLMHFPEGGGIVMDLAGPIQASSDGSHIAYVPPLYDNAGGALASTGHICFKQVTAGSGSTTVNFTSASAWSTSTSMAYWVIDVSAGMVFCTITSYGSGSVTFNSTSGHIYSVIAIGY